MMQPQSLPACYDSERALLCSMVLDHEALENGLSIPVGAFYDPSHLIFFQTLVEFHVDERPIDFFPIKKYLTERKQIEEIGGLENLNAIWTFVPTGANWKYYLNLVTDMHQRRVTILACQKIMSSMYDVRTEREESVRNEAERALSCLAVEGEEKDKTFKEQLLETLDHLETLSDTISTQGAVFGIGNVDRHISAMLPFENWMVAGESGSGKSALVSTQAALASALDKGLEVAVFSLEMEYKELIKRMLSSKGNISMRYMRDGKFPEHDLLKLTRTSVILNPASLHIIDDYDLDMRGIVTKCRKLKVQLSRENKKLGLIIIDYLQLVDGETNEERKELEYSNIVKRCKKMSKEFACPILGVSQLNEQKKLYGARSIKYHLDGLLIIDENENSAPGHINLCVVKMRNGPKGTRLPILFNSEFMTFTERREDKMPDPEPRKPYRNNSNRNWTE